MDMSQVPGSVGSPTIKVGIDDRNVDALGGPAAGGSMFPGAGFGLGGLGLGALGFGAGIGLGGFGGCGFGGYGAGLGSPLGVGFGLLGFGEILASGRNLAMQAQIQGAERAATAATAAVGRDVLLGQTQAAGAEGRTRELILQSQIALMQQGNANTREILAAIEREIRASVAEGRNLATTFGNSIAQLSLAQQQGFAQQQQQGIAQTAALAERTTAQSNALAASVAALQCLEQQCCAAQGTEGAATRNDIAASLAAMQQAIRALQATVCNVGTQANVNAGRIAAGLPTPVSVPFPGGACAGNGAVAGC
jgi:hypothetical protein